MNLNENKRIYQLSIGNTPTTEKVIRFTRIEDLREYLFKNGVKNENLQIIDVVSQNTPKGGVIETGRVMLNVDINT